MGWRKVIIDIIEYPEKSLNFTYLYYGQLRERHSVSLVFFNIKILFYRATTELIRQCFICRW